MSYHVEIYTTEDGKKPFVEWYNSLPDKKTQSIIDAGILKLRDGFFRNCKRLSSELYELKIYQRPGYRIYFVVASSSKLIVLCARTKHTQKKDIKSALKRVKEMNKVK